MSRPIVAHIRLDALRHNYLLARSIHGGRALAVIKSNAYGHGAIPCAKAIEDDADGFAVASIEEALVLREAGIEAPILLLEGFFESSELSVIASKNFWIVVHHLWQVEALIAARLVFPVTVWLKMDSGMHRLGLAPSDYRIVYERLKSHSNVSQVVLMNHFACADDGDSEHPESQVEIFRSTTNGIKAPISLANSAGVLGWPISYADWARPGIMLYGVNPLIGQHQQFDALSGNHLCPVMQLQSKIISMRTISRGEPIGYGCGFVADRTTRVGVVACGYADGYPRVAPTGTPVAVDSKLTRLIGRVSMDMLTVDLTDLPDANLGDQVELWGDQILVSEVANHVGTIAYELLCNVKRAQFIYSDSDKQ